MKVAKLWAAFLVSACCMSAGKASYPFWNYSLPWDDRVDDLVERLSVQEISDQMARGGGPDGGGPAPSISRLGIKPFQWDTECLRGIAFTGPATSFPQSIGLAAAFSTDMMYFLAEAISNEARARFNNATKYGDYGSYKGITCLAPFINIMRHPLWGRVQELYGEDPYLSGILAAAYVRGLHGNHPRYIRAGSGCKVVAAHSGPEDIPVSRFGFNAQVSMRDMYLTYLANVKTCVEAGTYNLMCSYNSINGVPACANKWLLTNVLRGEFRFKGYYISDMGAIENIYKYHKYVNSSLEAVVAAVNAGVNLELSPDGRISYFLQIYDAFNKGYLSRDTLMERVKPLFYTRMRLGEFDPPSMNPYNMINMSVVQSPEHQELSIQAAMKTFVLLKNNNETLPLKNQVFTVAVIGPMAHNPSQLMGDYAPVVKDSDIITPVLGLSKLGTRVDYAAGCKDNACTDYNQEEVKEACMVANVIFVCLGTGTDFETEGRDRKDLSLPGHQMQILQDAVKYGIDAKVVLLLFTGGPVDISSALSDPGVDAIVQCFFPAQGTGEALRRVLSVDRGVVNSPAARLPYTWPASMDQVPPMVNYSMEGRTYRYFKGTPLFPFGYGLSYTTFEYFYMDISPKIVNKEGTVTVQIGVANTGLYAADEVVQVYIRWMNATDMPQLQLVGFSRTNIGSGQSQRVTIRLTAEQFQVWDEAQGYHVQPGEVQLFAGGQQPFQKTAVPSNILKESFMVV